MSPEVSVVMSVYNGALYLREAVESILSQTFSDFEFIIVDDGSTDSTWDILSKFARCDERILLFRNPENVGLTKSLNKGLRKARGRFIARQDGDDISFPERLATQMAYLQRRDDVGLLGTAYYKADSQSRRSARIYRHPQTDTEIRWKMLFHNTFCHTSVIFQRKLFEVDNDFYNEDLPYSQDYDLWVRLLRQTCAANLPTPLVAFRMHESSIRHTHCEEQRRIATAISARQIGGLIPQRPLSGYEVDTLRLWYQKFPLLLSEQDTALCLLLLQIFREFARQQNLDPKALRRLRQHWIGRMLGALPISRRHLRRSGLLRVMLSEDARSVFTETPKETIRWIVRWFRRRKAYFGSPLS
jgi:hypothetical protein